MCRSDQTYPFVLLSILSTGSRSDGSQCPDHKLAALGSDARRRRLVSGVAGVTGSEKEGEDVHRVRRRLGELKEAMAGEGAHEGKRNSSPEFGLATAGSGQG